MAWLLRYTSAEFGPTGRSGFQFVAMTPGTPPDAVRLATPYMSYRPPPGAPSAPAPHELAAFPTAFAYGREGADTVLARCRYAGRDYSGRFGNFIGQAVVAAPDELEGLRPIEFWDAPVWDAPVWDAPVWDAPLADDPWDADPDLVSGGTPGFAEPLTPGGPDLLPGAAFDPDLIAGWLVRGRTLERLAALLDAVTTALHDGHGRVVLVSADPALIARWIAVVSYCLPPALAARLSFTTYTPDPADAPQLITGTVPGAWAGSAFDLDEPSPAPAQPSRFARTMAECWRSGDLDGIDAVGELLDAVAREDPATPASVPSRDAPRPSASPRSSPSCSPEPRGVVAQEAFDGAAALLALCRHDSSVSTTEQTAAAALLRRAGPPSWVWPAVEQALPRVEFELAAALAAAAAPIAEHCVLLALADPRLAGGLPTIRLGDGLPERFRDTLAAVTTLGELPGILRIADRVGGRVDPADVVAAAAARARRGAGDIAAALRDTPPDWRDAVVFGVLTGLEAGPARTRAAMLTPEACAALGERDWSRTPRTGGLVLSAHADRCAATAGLVDLEPHGLPNADTLLAALWRDLPTVAECLRLVERLGAGMMRFAALRPLPRRVLESAPLDAEDTVLLAELVRDRLPDAAAAARMVLAHGAALRAESGREVARLLGLLDAGDDPLAARARDCVAGALSHRPAAFRAEIVAAAPGPVRDHLARHWTGAYAGRAERADLAEVTVRVERVGIHVAPLREWADGLGRFARRNVESVLAGRDPELASAWRARRRED